MAYLELTAALLLFTVAIGGIVGNQSRAFGILKYLVVIIYIAAVRVSGLDGDFVKYIHVMQYGADPVIYAWEREFLFWIPLYYLYQFFQNEYAVILFLDGIWLSLLYFALSRQSLDRKRGTLFLILILSFPFFLFYQNVYRQIFSTICLIAAYTYRDKSQLKSELFFFGGVLIHNSILVFYPILLARKFFGLGDAGRQKLYYGSLAAGVALMIAMNFTFLNILKLGYDTGQDLSYAYILLFIIIALFLVLFAGTPIRKLIDVSPATLTAILVLIPLKLAGFESTLIERLGLTFLCIAVIDLYNISGRIKYVSRQTFQVLLLAGLFLPVIVFPSSRSMLLSYQREFDQTHIRPHIVPIVNSFLLDSSSSRPYGAVEEKDGI